LDGILTHGYSPNHYGWLLEWWLELLLVVHSLSARYDGSFGKRSNNELNEETVDPNGPLVAVLAAIALCVVNTAVGYVVAKKAFEKELNTFLGMVFGSLAIRLVVVIAFVYVLISQVGLHQLAFSLTFVIVGFLLIMGEILFFHTSYEKKKFRSRRPVTELLKKKVEFMMRHPYEPSFA
jgi:ABC-type tungstate transport system substrate-binding protein